MRFSLILFSFFVVSCSQGNAETENFNAINFQPDLNKIPVEGCPAILNHNIRVLDSKDIINLCEHKDKVVLAVNVATFTARTTLSLCSHKLMMSFESSTRML